jgi:hypothetical protein
LVEALLRHGVRAVLDSKDTVPGEDFHRFMDHGIEGAQTRILICSENYTEKANNLQGGVGYETRLFKEALSRKTTDFRLIPVIRNNPRKQLPSYINSLKAVDMDRGDWEAEPLLQLVRGLRT